MGHVDPYAMALTMPSGLLTKWMAHTILNNSDADPEPTKWDDAESRKRKAKRKAMRKEKWR